MKKNFRKVPPLIRRKLDKISSKSVVVAAARSIALEDITSGGWNHLGLSFGNESLIFENEVVPKASRGRFSEKNVNGWLEKHRDLPKIIKTFTMEVPNFGDWSKGSHEISQDREVYQSTFHPPRELAIEIERLKDIGDTHLNLKFRVNSALKPGEPSFEADLLFSLNLLQENVGAIGIFEADAGTEEYLDSIYHKVGWEILPPGQREPNLQLIVSKLRKSNPEIIQLITERYDLLMSLGPQHLIQGHGGFDGYFGAKFSDKLVAFENLKHGHALYVMRDDWKELCQKSRTELLDLPDRKFDRIVHSPGWEQELRSIIKKRRAEENQ